MVSERGQLEQASKWFTGWFHGEVVAPIINAIPGFRPSSRVASDLFDIAIQSENIAAGKILTDEIATWPLRYRQIAKRILLSFRLFLARFAEEQTDRTYDSAIRVEQMAPLERLNAALAAPGIKDVVPIKVPPLSQFLAGNLLRQVVPPPHHDHDYDDKFQLLFSSRFLHRDLRRARDQCRLYGRTCLLAYIDIDNFGALNKRYTETKVDELVLPRFMGFIDSMVFGHGYAYRIGGDEYAVLLPNADYDLGITFVQILQSGLRTLQYPEIDSAVTVSIGVSAPASDCFLTEREIVQTANNAKNVAKDQGKDRIAVARIGEMDHSLPTEFTVLQLTPGL